MKSKCVIIVASIFCALSVCVMVLALTFVNSPAKSEYIPPEFDSSAISGTPNVDKNLHWSKVRQQGMTYTAYICANLVLNNNSTNVYLLNDSGNKVWLKLRILDEQGNTLGETGLIKPGEYLKSVKFDNVPETNTQVRMKIMAYEPNTYYSAGSVSLNTTIV